MVTKAFDNDLVDGRTVKAFRPRGNSEEQPMPGAGL